MPDDPSAGLLALRDARERAVSLLSDAFARDVIGVDEFERRLTLVHRAGSIAEIGQTVSDLAPGQAAQPSLAAPAAPILAGAPSAADVTTVFAGVERRGSWTLPQGFRAVAVMGGVVLDLRDASLAPGVTEIRVAAILGGVQLIVPPSLSVEVTGTAILGGFDHVDRVPAQADPGRPVLRVHGFALMGGIAVETRLPGEGEREAHRRRRGERRAFARGEEPKRLPEKTGV